VSERRVAFVLVLLLLGQLLFLALQVPAKGSGSEWVERLALRMVAPIPLAIAGLGELVTRLEDRLARARALRSENRALRQENERLRLELMQAGDLENQVARLTEALDYARHSPGSLFVADITYADYSSWFRTLLVYVGNSGAEVNQPVLSNQGLVGRIVLVAGPHAKVQLVTDRAASVGGMIERTRRQGVVRGEVGGGLELAYVPRRADVRVGDQVVTAGIDGIYPRGIPIGTVSSVEPGESLFHRIRVTPAVDFGLIDQVYVLTNPPLSDDLKRAQPGASP
jgi:rod shape-determining protein MreC